MGQDQEKKHVCRLCNKSFLSGKMLGGHMRIHAAKNLMKEEAKLVNSNMGFDGYGLRENPKKSWKFSGLKHDDSAPSPGRVKCKVCGKEFQSPRSLHGHLRHHTPQERKGLYCKECGRGFLSPKSLTNHMRLHSEKFMASSESRSSSELNLVVMTLSDTETVKLVRRKRSKRMRYKIDPNSSCSSLNESVSGFEIEQEVEEVAMCLMMLSRGVCRFGGFNLYQNKRIEVDESEGISDGDNLVKTKKSRLEKSDSDIAEDSGKKSEFKCRICSKKFPSYQSLGGHQTFHRTTKSCFALKVDNLQKDVQTEFSPKIEATSKLELIQDSVDQEMDGVAVEGYESKKGKEHQCTICFKIFVSGQALGGHKKCHFGKASEEKTIAMKQEVRDICDDFDINVPYIGDEEANHEDQVKSWWVGGGCENESLVGLVTN